MVSRTNFNLNVLSKFKLRTFHKGLYSAFFGGFIYSFLGGCKEINIGPTALLSLMVSKHSGLGGESGPHLAILLCFLAGVVEFLMAILKLGALVDLISLPVTVGFTSATALIIGEFKNP